MPGGTTITGNNNIVGDNNTLVYGDRNSISTATTSTSAVNGSATGTTDARSSSSDSNLASLPKGQRDRALTLANRQLAAAGISNPTPQQQQAALAGGTVTNAQGQTTEMAGVLQLRSEGLGWGQIAHTIGVHPAQSEQGASRSMRGFGGGERVASISGSQSHALTRDSGSATGSSSVSLSGRDRENGGGFSSATNRSGGERGQIARAASGAMSQSSLRTQDTQARSVGAAASQSSLQDRGGSASAATALRGKEAGGEARAGGAALAKSGISSGGTERGPSVRGGPSADKAADVTHGSRDRGNSGKSKKN